MEELTPAGELDRTATSGRRTRWAWWLATWFGAGYGRPGPGTYGSCAAVILWMLAAWWFRPTPRALAISTFIAATVVTLIGIPAATLVAREAGREDPGFVVVDEVAGQLIALVGLSATWPQALLALVLFRAFDITKPWPIRRLEELPGGTGIMLDDVAAGVLAALAAQVLLLGFHIAVHQTTR